MPGQRLNCSSREYDQNHTIPRRSLTFALPCDRQIRKKTKNLESCILEPQNTRIVRYHIPSPCKTNNIQTTNFKIKRRPKPNREIHFSNVCSQLSFCLFNQQPMYMAIHSMAAIGILIDFRCLWLKHTIVGTGLDEVQMFLQKSLLLSATVGSSK
jgi:hypothetical protein